MINRIDKAIWLLIHELDMLETEHAPKKEIDDLYKIITKLKAYKDKHSEWNR